MSLDNDGIKNEIIDLYANAKEEVLESNLPCRRFVDSHLFSDWEDSIKNSRLEMQILIHLSGHAL